MTEVIVYEDADELASAAADRFLARLAEAQSVRGHASAVLTGGRVGTAMLAAAGRSPAGAAVDWSSVDFWWGDERFLPPGDPERNETQAREALLDRIAVDPGRVHPIPADHGAFAGDPEAAAAAYADELANAAGPDPVPAFDVLLLGVGPDGHVASLFPGFSSLREERTVVAVHGAPKPPPTRISLTMPALRAATQVWMVVAGADKAGAVGEALGGSDVQRIPAAGVAGRPGTRWLLDRAAATDLPPVGDPGGTTP